ncbi:hypothetical protein H0H87_003377, partial [Tephrocybe sp. NHM501043]
CRNERQRQWQRLQQAKTPRAHGTPVRLSPLLLSVTDTPVVCRYYADPSPSTAQIKWPPQVPDYNKRFTKVLETIKSRHDPTVTTVAQGVLEWKRVQGKRNIGLDIQAWLDRFYMSRIGIRFLIGQRTCLV